jgi:hypothetical protein
MQNQNKPQWWYDKEKLKGISCITLFVIGLFLAVFSIMSPPEGVIDASVLTFFGEAIVYVAAVFGIDLVRFKKSVDK